jgi:2-polyprenyl-6-methoxyphenol hydroxylase-like FAD-dependent oxidoreductase
MSSFKVLIVGGSVAGLTLALILERYNIDYMLLEKHDTIAPPLGAGIGLQAHGLRIMEQLGIYEKLASLGMPLNKLKTFAPGGRLLSDQPTAGDLFEEL